MVQIHGLFYNPTSSILLVTMTCLIRLDYEGDGMSSRTENLKRAASEASKIFQDHYPEFLVCLLFALNSLPLIDLVGISSVPQIFCQCTLIPDLDLLVVQTFSLVGHSRQDDGRGFRSRYTRCRAFACD